MKRVSVKRIAVALPIFFLGVALIGMMVVHVFLWRWANEIAATPSRLTPLPSVAPLSIRNQVEVNAFGWSVKVPNTTVREEPGPAALHNRASMSRTVSFEDHSSVSFLNFGPQDPWSQYRNDPAMRKIFTPQDVQTSYALMSASLSLNRPRFSIWEPNSHYLREYYLSILTPFGEAIHPIRNGVVRGFETDHTASGRTVFTLDVFDRSDHTIKLICLPPSGVDQQAWINALVDSLQPPA